MAADRRTLIQQLALLERLPVTTSVTIERGRLSWTGELQPSPLSDIYTVHISYVAGEKAPTVTVPRPELRAAGVESLPHVYTGDHLCLYYPWQWTNDKLITRTIIPWASEWLLHYEIWKATSTWHGGGHEPAAGAATA
jgi:hypothetical protein